MNTKLAAMVLAALGMTVTFAPTASVCADGGATPVLVELFTSEGCSSCPPADKLLDQLDKKQPVGGAQTVVLSEHVDYWNSLGWNDPYSSRSLSNRQARYASRFDANGYTPQMVVDGQSQFVGSNARAAAEAIQKALKSQHLAVRIYPVSFDNDKATVRVDTDTLPAWVRSRRAEVFVAVALNRAEQQVLRGENMNMHLSHTSVVRSLVKAGEIEREQPFSRQVEIPIETGVDRSNLRIVAFVQETGQGRVLGSAMKPVEK